MELGEKDIKRFSVFILIALVGIMAFFIIRPIFYSIVSGLLLAYVFMPVFRKVYSFTENKTLSAFIILIIALIIIIIPIWFVTPVIIQQVFEIFKYSQSLDITGIIHLVFPTSSQQFVAQAALTASTLLSQLTSSLLSFLVGIFLNLPSFAVGIVVAAFVFFYTLRDYESLADFVKGLSPIAKSKEKIIVEQFKTITDSIIYGQIIVGILQGILAGLGLLVAGVPNALVLTILAVFISMIPFLGPYLIWVPVAIYLFSSGQTAIAIIYLIYNLVLVSTVDNVIRSYLVSKRTNLSQAIVIIGMLGGLALFGILGLVIGPLVIAYFLTLLKSYKEKNLYSLFSDEDEKK